LQANNWQPVARPLIWDLNGWLAAGLTAQQATDSARTHAFGAMDLEQRWRWAMGTNPGFNLFFLLGVAIPMSGFSIHYQFGYLPAPLGLYFLSIRRKAQPALAARPGLLDGPLAGQTHGIPIG